jgi:O-antigen/teichoic acid export membrane protein
MTTWVAGTAVLAWLVGVVVLGLQWHGEERAPGIWIDGVSLVQWLLCWLLLAVLAMGVASRLRGWPARLLAMVPLSAWVVWQLRASALGPIAMVVYLVPTVLVWCGALQLSMLVRRKLARSVKQL